MIRVLCDEDFHGDILNGLFGKCPEAEFVRVQDVELTGEDGADDPAILAWAAEHNMVVLTHDRNTMTAHARARLASNLPLSGIIVVNAHARIATIIEDIRLLLAFGPGQWDSPIVFVPLRP